MNSKGTGYELKGIWIDTIKMDLNRLTPNDPYMGRTAPLTSKRCILYIYSTNTGTEYFKHALYSLFCSLQNAVCFIMLTCLVPVLFTFYIQAVLKLKKNNSGAKGLSSKWGCVMDSFGSWQGKIWCSKYIHFDITYSMSLNLLSLQSVWFISQHFYSCSDCKASNGSMIHMMN